MKSCFPRFLRSRGIQRAINHLSRWFGSPATAPRLILALILAFFGTYFSKLQIALIFFGLTYMGDILRDDRIGQKPTLKFSENFCISTPDGVRAFVYVFILWPLWGLRKAELNFFWVQHDPWLKAQHIYQNWTG